MYNLVFWDWIPTVAMHKYYCSTEAGFWVYKTVDQWKAANPGVFRTLSTQRVWQPDHGGVGDVVHINQRFDLIYKKDGPYFLHLWRRERGLLDTQTKKVIARYINYSAGNGNIGGEPESRFWLHSDFCASNREKAIQFGELTTQSKREGKMSTVQDVFQQAQLAEAAYADFSNPDGVEKALIGNRGQYIYLKPPPRRNERNECAVPDHLNSTAGGWC